MTTAIAMSGGVDSSTAAALLAETRVAGTGGSLVGLTMQLWNQRRLPALQGLAAAGPLGHASGRCCSLEDVYDARRVANFLGIPYYVVNFEERFEREVVRPFVEGYLAGETPIPCARCNTEIKFRDFVDTAREIGAERIATGHYARVRWDESTGRYHLLAAADATKDQSYFLFGLTQQQLSRAVFPLGELTKNEVRAIACRMRLPVAEKAESQEICFVPGGSYRDFIEAYRAEQGAPAHEETPGEVVRADGRVLAEHRGIQHFTVGQRKGLGVATGEPLYVIEIQPESNRVVAGPAQALLRRACWVRDVNWISPMAEGGAVRAAVRIRNKHTPSVARVVALANHEALVQFAEPQRAITPGQAAVFYDGEEVLGGGWISKAQ